MRRAFHVPLFPLFALVPLVLAIAGEATATEAAPGAGPPAEAPASPAPAPYSLPFQLRPAAAVSVARWDSTLALYEGPSPAEEAAHTVVSTVLVSYKVTDHIAPFLRGGLVSNSPPAGDGATGMTNPIVGVMYGRPLGGALRFSATAGVALPLASGAGNDPDPAAKLARSSGVPARASLDNALFAGNDLVLFPGVDLAWVKGGVTIQVEATVLQLLQLRGDERAQPDDSRTNLTGGLHVGYFLLPELSLGAELRHQRWLSTPKDVAAPGGAPRRDTTTVAIGPRAHLPLGSGRFLRPGLSYARGLDAPMTDARYHLVQLDVPFLF
ncbi:MAG: hypothetical protein FJ104_00795 [Deltaproteobacteria bacterium]|nr:hypothetical protein [Deltaproteobacteria bacterium]